MSRKLIIAGGVLASLGLLAYLIGGRVTALTRIAGQLEWPYVAVAVLCAMASYFMVGLALREVLALLGHSLSFPVVLGIALTSTTVNSPLALSGTLALGLAGQVIFGLAADRWGLFGMPVRIPRPRDLAALALIVAGSALIILFGMGAA